MKITTVAAALATLTLAAGCSAADLEAAAERARSTETVTTTAAPAQSLPDDEVVEPVTQTSDEDVEDLFIDALDDQGLTYGTRDEGIRTGLTVCAFIDQGNSVSDLFWEMAYDTSGERVLPNVPNDDLPAVMGVSVAIFCPEFTARVDRDLGR